jgi:hypothetical protein
MRTRYPSCRLTHPAFWLDRDPTLLQNRMPVVIEHQ